MHINKNGYTLLEIIVYTSILAVIAMVSLGTILSMYRSLGKINVDRKIVLNGDTAMETIIREIRTATSTNIDGSIFGTNPGILALSHGKKFLVSSGNIVSQDGAGPEAQLTSDITVNRLVFYRATSTNSDIIKIDMTIESGSGVFFTQKNFFGSAVTRESY